MYNRWEIVSILCLWRVLLQAEFIQHLVHFGQFVFMEVAELYAFLCVVVNLSGTAAGKIGNEIADLREVVGILSHLTSRCRE